MSRAPGIEPYDSHHFIAYVVKEHGAVFDRQTGSHQLWRLPNGRVVGAINNGKAVMPCSLARKNAGQLGMSYGDMRGALGHPIIDAGKVSKVAKVKRADTPKVGKADALRALRALASDVRDLEAECRQGIHNQKVYESIFTRAMSARRAFGTGQDAAA